MKAIVQRVRQAQVTVDGKTIARIAKGLVVLLGVAKGDSSAEAAYLANKIAGLRIFEDEQGKMNRSLEEAGGAVLVVSQFTLLGNCRKGRRPSFEQAAPPEQAETLYREFIEQLKGQGVETAQGKFQAQMLVQIYNDGPVTLILESK